MSNARELTWELLQQAGKDRSNRRLLCQLFKIDRDTLDQLLANRLPDTQHYSWIRMLSDHRDMFVGLV